MTALDSCINYLIQVKMPKEGGGEKKSDNRHNISTCLQL